MREDQLFDSNPIIGRKFLELIVYNIYQIPESEIKKEDKESIMRLHLIILNGINPCLIERNQ